MAGKPASRVRGPGEARFREAPGPGERCRAAVEEPRRPDGFVCPVCGGAEGEWPKTRPKVRCSARRHQTSPTAGTMFHAAEPPLTTRLLAMWRIATAENGIGAGDGSASGGPTPGR